MTRPLLLFDAFVPPGDVEGSAQPQVRFVDTFADCAGTRIPVLLSDVGQAERAVRADRGSLRALLAEKPGRARVPYATEDADSTLALLSVLLGEEDLEIDVVISDGSTPPLPTSERLHVSRAGELAKVTLESYGPLQRDMLANGVVWHDGPTSICHRPQRVSLLENGPAELLGALEQHLTACQAAFPGGIPGRALELRIDGTRAFQDPLALSRLLGVASVRGFELRAIRYRGDGSATGLLSALHEAIRYTLRGSPVELRIEPSKDALVELARQILDKSPLDLERLEALHQAWSSAAPKDQRVRYADDILRRAVFRGILTSDQSEVIAERAANLLGPPRNWIDAYRRFSKRGTPRLAVVPTWQCELRCTYCTIPKQDGRVMSEQTLEQAIELLLSSESRDLELQFSGGEPFVEWQLVKHACEWGTERAQKVDAKIKFVFTTNGFALTREMVEWLAVYDARFQLSLDGDSTTQNAFRRALTPELDSYEKSAANHGAWFRDAHVKHHVIQVVHPHNVEQMDLNFAHILDLGFQKVQLRFALGTRWPKDSVVLFAEGLHRIAGELEQRWSRGENVALLNLRDDSPAGAHAQVTVDHDGSLFASEAFLYLPKYRAELALGHLADLRSFDRHSLDGLDSDEVMRHWYLDPVAENNQQVAAVTASFVKWMRDRHPEREAELASSVDNRL